jgi:hypothetical protein
MFQIPREGTLFTMSINSDIPVESYIVRPGGLDRFDNGSTTFKYYGGYPRARKFQFQEVKLPRSGTWYLLIVNRERSRNARLKYDVFY